MSYKLFDPGAWPEPSICRKIIMKIAEPWRPELTDKQKQIVEQTLKAARARGPITLVFRGFLSCLWLLAVFVSLEHTVDMV